jgi:hypothetical protein
MKIEAQSNARSNVEHCARELINALNESRPCDLYVGDKPMDAEIARMIGAGYRALARRMEDYAKEADRE